METEQIIICLFFIVFFFILFLFVRYIPIKIVKMRAKKYDMKLNTTDVKELIKMRCVKNSFFKLISVFVREGLEYDVVQLAFHYVSGGNLAEASELLGRNVEIDLSGLPANVSFRGDSAYFLYDARNSGRVVPPSGNYRARTQGVEAVVFVENGIITVPESIGRKGFGDEKIEFLAA